MQQGSELGGAGGELEAAPGELDDRDRREVGALPRGIGVDVTLEEPGGRLRGCGPLRQQGFEDVAGLVAQAAGGPRVQDDVGNRRVLGEGSAAGTGSVDLSARSYTRVPLEPRGRQ